MTKPILDISHHQLASNFDWKKVSAAVAGLIIRVQYGSTTIDRQYKAHVTSAKANGISFGHYAYGLFTGVQDAIKEANDFLYRIDKSAKFLMLDVEKYTLAACGPTNLAAASQAFIDTCKKAGYKTGLYVSHEMYKKYGMDKVKTDFLMLPRYGKDNGTPDLKPDYPCDIWQYSQKCKIPGYNGTVDLSLLYGSKPMSYFFPEPVKADKPIEKPKANEPKTDEYMYIVKSGDVLSKIAPKYGMTAAEMAKLNGLDNPNKIYVGQRLKTKGAAKQAPKPKAIYYTVKKGDTLSGIAARYKTTTAKLDALNANVVNVNKIYPGMRIRIK
jgi:GH25 family lysozyme M1 (1,4-beta-N-acetylmuramidase)/LysM repeat protein